jgi:hypothetical protein
MVSTILFLFTFKIIYSLQEGKYPPTKREETLQHPIRKTVYTLNLNGYSPEITELTYPLIKHYANKIGAEFYVIDKREFPKWPITYEKLQIYKLSHERQDDWSIFLDSDALVHPETIDWTIFLPKDTVAHNGSDFAPIRWKYDKYFLRDGRNIGSCNWNTIASSWCQDLWHPLDISPEEAVGALYPTVEELNTVIVPNHLVDDYALSRNIARYGLKAKTLLELQKDIGLTDANFYWHAYTISVEDKVKNMRSVLRSWKLGKYYSNQPYYMDDYVEGWASVNELGWLYQQARKMDSIVEIGSWKGCTTKVLLTACKGKVYAIDHWLGSPSERTGLHEEATIKNNQVYAEFLGNVGYFPNLHILKLPSEQAVKYFAPKSVDMVFIDGSHAEADVLKDIKMWAPVCKKLLCGHDLYQEGVPTALMKSGLPFKRECDTLWSCEVNGK